MSINYSDGEEVEQYIRELIKNADDRSTSSSIGADEYNQWAIEYHLCPERTNLLRPFNFSGLDVLEVGAGMGAISRLLAERAKHLTIIEGTESRFANLSERLKDLNNWKGQVSNLIDAQVEEKVDVVVVIGVLEYAEKFIPADKEAGLSPFDRFLKACTSFLKPDGVLILAIENRIGLKYWTGVGEDHLSTQFDGVCGYSNAHTAKTFSKKELATLFEKAGFDNLDWFYPYPDYKIPNAILSQQMIDQYPKAAAALASSRLSRDYVIPKAPRSFPEMLSQYGMASAGLLDEFSNSFLTLVSHSGQTRVSDQLLSKAKDGELAWYYSNRRLTPIETTFANKTNALTVSKQPMGDQPAEEIICKGQTFDVTWRPINQEPFCEGTQFLEEWYREGYFGDMSSALSLLKRFLQWSQNHWKTDSGQPALPGEALDAVAPNAVLTDEGFALFDQEWRSSEPIPFSWFILRNLMCLHPHSSILATGNEKVALKDLYAQLCTDLHAKPDLAGDIEKESTFQSLTDGKPMQEIRARIKRDCDSFLPQTGFRRRNEPPINNSLPAKISRRLKSSIKRVIGSR